VDGSSIKIPVSPFGLCKMRCRHLFNVTENKIELFAVPCGMYSSAFPDDHGHDGIFICLSSCFVEFYCLVDVDTADEVSRYEDKVRSDDSMSVDVAQGVTGCKSFLRGDDRFDANSRMGRRRGIF
jgi:hypothetical protein